MSEIQTHVYQIINFKVKKHAILENHLNHQLNIIILRNFAYYEMFCEVFFFSSQLYLNVIFLYWPRFFILNKNLSTARMSNELKQNLLH